MYKQIVSSLTICLTAGSLAHAQSSGGGRYAPGGGGVSTSTSASAPATSSAPPPVKPTPPSQIEIVGVVTAIDVKAERITIAYDAVEALNWPRGTTPFVVAKSAFLTGVTVGEKVRFKIDSQQIADLRPF